VEEQMFGIAMQHRSFSRWRRRRRMRLNKNTNNI